MLDLIRTSLFHPLRSPLRHLLAAWTDVRLSEPAPEALGLDTTLPTIYVLPRPALSDALLLEAFTHQHHLPSAKGRLDLDGLSVPCCMALPAPRSRWWPGSKVEDTPFAELIERGIDVQLIPVSVFWGRAPGKNFGFWQLLAADSWQLTGRLRRALSVLVNGRDVEIQWGAPLRLTELSKNDTGTLDPARTHRKAARLLRVHFRRVKTRVLGPDLSHRRTLIQGVISSPAVHQAITETHAAGNGSRRTDLSRLKRRAARYGNEIASSMTYPVLRFLAGILRRLWNRLYDGVEVTGLDKVKALAGDHTLIYVPCHRSHIDYLLLSYVLYRDGLMPPHIAAGRNLDMPLVGPLLRRGGAFFLRRSFRDNRLYGAVFTEYLHRLLARGYPMEYFIEGGRSRSGRMLPPRPGMLAMTLRSFLRSQQEHAQPMVFVPIYIGYERILENASYQRELSGGRKRKETPLALIRTLGRLREPYGRVSVNIGEPLDIATFLDDSHSGWRDAPSASSTDRADWFKQAIPALGDTIIKRINAVAALNPVNLVGLALLATPHRALEVSTLRNQLDILKAMALLTPGSTLPEGSAAEWIEHVMQLDMIEQRRQSLGDIVTANAQQAALLGWYRNNVLHVFALPALVAFALSNDTSHDGGWYRLDDLETLLAPLWPILARELSVSTGDDLRAQIASILNTLVELELVDESVAGYMPMDSLQEQESLHLLGGVIQPSLERNTLLLEVLLEAAPGTLKRDELCERARGLAERLAVLTGREAPEFFDARLFEGLVDSLIKEGWVWITEDHLMFGEHLRDTTQRVAHLLDPALRQRLALIHH